MKRGIRFKVWRGPTETGVYYDADGQRVGQFYVHLIAGNNEITLSGEGYPDARTAHKAVESIWRGFGQAFKFSAADITEHFPVPYTRDSLKP